MADLSPFAALSAFASASPPADEPSPGSEGSPAPLSRVGSRTVGFQEPLATALEPSPKPAAACHLAERQHSMGSLGQLLRAAQAEQARPRLTIATTRSLRLPAAGRVKRVPRIMEHEEAAAAGSSSDLLGGTAPSREALPGMGMHRSSSIDIGPTRLSKAQTAPDALPDSLVLAAINAGYAEGPSPNRCASPAAASAASTLPGRQGQLHAAAGEGGGGTLPSRQGQLHMAAQAQPRQPPSPHQPHQRSGSSGSTVSDSSSTAAGGSGRPPMPVTPAALAASRSGSQPQRLGSARSLMAPSQQARQGGGRSPHITATRQGSYKELFDAQTEAAMAQATLAGLHEALRRRDEEIERLQQQLARVSGERDELLEVASSSAAAVAATAQHVNALAAAAAGGGGGAGSGGAPAGAGSRGGATTAAAAGLQPSGGPLPRLHSAGHGLRGLQRSAHALQQAAHPPPAAQPPPPGEGMVSAFAGALPFSFE